MTRAGQESCQLLFGFDQRNPTDGIALWRQQREATVREVACKLGLPLGHLAELILRTGPVVRGRLLLDEESLFVDAGGEREVRLRMGGFVFTPAEVESCVRLD